jgi:diguanylate cyclase (GGDEF)-like protein
VRALSVDPGGDVWIATNGAGVFRFRDGRYEGFGAEQGLSSQATFSLRHDRGGQLWVGAQRGLNRYVDGRFERVPAARELDESRVFAIADDRHGNLWIAAEGKGLCRLARETLTCDATIEGLGNDLVRTFHEDREGSLWIGSTNGGLHRLSESKLATITSTAATSSVRTVTQLADGDLLAGLDGGGLAHLRDGVLVEHPLSTRLASPFLRSIRSDADGTIWIGSLGGLSRVRGDEVTNYSTRSGLIDNVVYTTEPAKDGLWIGTSKGLMRMSEDRFETLLGDEPMDVRALHDDHRGRLWVGLREGLRCRDGEVFTHCGLGTDLTDATVFTFHRENEDTLWIGTSNGVLRVRGNEAVRYGTRDGMFDDIAFQILDDDAGNFWMTSNRGIYRVARADFDAYDRGHIGLIGSVAYGKADGMRSAQCNGASQPAAWKSRDGRLWIATAGGLVLVDPRALEANSTPPPVSIERVVVDDVDTDPHTLARVGPGIDKLEFHYAGMSFIAPEKVRYRYRLEGFDRDWVDAGSRRAAYYTNLAPGDYAFRVRASNNDGIWNEAGATLPFAIVPYFHESAAFRIGVLAGIAVGIVALYRLRLWRMHQRERVLVGLVDARTDALRRANAELHRLASLDGLTRLGNRATFDEMLDRLWQDHRERQAPLALLLCDIDYFKSYNDTYGHPAGDEALQRVAAVLDGSVRERRDVAARYGGEEFVLLLSNTAPDEAMAFAVGLLDRVRDLRVPHAGSTAAPYLTLSIGLAARVPNVDQPPDMLLAEADQALYRAKAAGRDRARAADPAG